MSLRYPREPIFESAPRAERSESATVPGLPPEEYRARLEEAGLAELVPAFERVCDVARTAEQWGGRALVVGGAVRDEVLGMPAKDFDVEVYGVPVDEIEALLFASRFGMRLEPETIRHLQQLATHIEAETAGAGGIIPPERDLMGPWITEHLERTSWAPPEMESCNAIRAEEIVDWFHRINTVGRAFGIIKMRVGDADVDCSIPRRESKTGTGHKGFTVEGDPTMTIEEAARRRDFTMNALAKNPLTGEIYDYFGGVDDLRNRTLRMTDAERFGDDSLRILRGMQFMARFGLRLDTETAEVMRRLAPSLTELPRERIGEEWKKLLIKGQKPSLGLAAGMQLGVFDALHVELPPLVHTPQEEEWHPEGDVWVHTMMAVDRAVELCQREGLSEAQTAIVVFAVLCHDFGKPPTTKEEEGRIRSRGHEEAGEAPARAFLESLSQPKELIEAVVGLVRDHLKPGEYYLKEHPKDPNRKPEPVTDTAIRNLAKRIAPATLEQLVLVAQADHQGRGPFVDPKEPEQYLLNWSDAGRWFLARARAIGVEREPPPPLIQGRDCVGLGFRQGKEIGALIALAGTMRDARNWTREEALQCIAEIAERTGHDAAETVEEFRKVVVDQWCRSIEERIAAWTPEERAARTITLLDGRPLTPEDMAARIRSRLEDIGLHDMGTLTMTMLLRGEPLPEVLARNRDAILTAHEAGPVWFTRFDREFYNGAWKSFYGCFENTEARQDMETLKAHGPEEQLRRGSALIARPDAKRIKAYDAEHAAIAPVESDGILARYDTVAYPFERGLMDGYRMMVQYNPETKRLAVSILDEDPQRVAALDRRVRDILPEFADARHTGYLFAARDGRDDVWTAEDGKRVYDQLRSARILEERGT